jgi:hypothetical protein
MPPSHGLAYVGRYLGLGLNLYNKIQCYFKFSLLGGAYVISSSCMAIEKI